MKDPNKTFLELLAKGLVTTGQMTKREASDGMRSYTLRAAGIHTLTPYNLTPEEQAKLDKFLKKAK